MPRQLRCAGFPTAPAHLTRTAEPGFQNVVGIREDQTGAIIVDPDGRLCGACNAAKIANDGTSGDLRRLMIKNIRDQFVTAGFTNLQALMIVRQLFGDSDSPT